MRARRGSGRVFQLFHTRDGKRVPGQWRIGYTWKGRRYKEMVPILHPDRPTTKSEAQQFLKKRFAEQVNGEFSPAMIGSRGVSYEHLRDGLLAHYEVNGLKSLKTARDGVTRYLSGQSHLDSYFKGRHALDISTAEVERFTIERRGGGASNANISASLRLLRRMFYLAVERKELGRNDVPTIKPPKEPPARKGFLEPKDFPKLYAAMPDDLRAVLTLGFDVGMRLGEVQNLRWKRVDLLAGEIHLTAEETKTSVARTIPLGRMLEVFRRMRSQRPGDEYVFSGSAPLGNFRKRWNTACIEAGVGRYVCASCSQPWEKKHACEKPRRKYAGLTFHDLRRSAARNLVRGGTSESVAMKITGHKTRDVFSRYNITDTRDIHNAIERSNQYVEQKLGEGQGNQVVLEQQKQPEKNSLIQ